VSDPASAAILGRAPPTGGPVGLVVIDPRGTVVAVDCGAPAAWVGRSLDTLDELPDDVREAARALVVACARTGAESVRQIDVASSEREGFSLRVQALRAVALRPTRFVLDELVRRVVGPLGRWARGGLALDIEAEASFEVVGDANKVGWAVTAIVGTALRQADRASDDGGHVAVRVRKNAQLGRAVVSVVDDGEGIPAEVRAWLFEPKPETGTVTGLALRLVDEIVAAHGGEMVVLTPTDAATKRGTEISLWLPTHG
jgi:light-regulated signal transduction histidine kinase (bacteriophytochrome)